MKKILVTLICFLTVVGIQAQTKTTTYYKNSEFNKEVPKNRAKYKIVRFTDHDTIVYESYKIKGHRFLTDIKTLNGHATGIWYKYDKQGNLIYRDDFRPLLYSNAQIKDEQAFNKHEAKNKSFTRAEFPGGKPGLTKFVKIHIHYPAMSDTTHHSGTVLVLIKIHIEKDGTAVPYSIVQGVNPSLDLAAWNVIKEMPKWTPAQKDGKPVGMMVNLPVRFKSSLPNSVTPAKYPGGISALMKFLKAHIHYPAMSETMHHYGTVLIKTRIEKDGTAVPYSIVKGVNPSFDLAVWNAIKEMPKWTPAQKDGKPVGEIVSLPVKFSSAPSKSVTRAEFPGGIPELMKFLKTHIHYPAMSETMHHYGTVLIRFIVEKDGTAVPYSIVRGVDPFLDLAAWNVIKEMPKWTPAQKDGKPVSEKINLPVKFMSNQQSTVF